MALTEGEEQTLKSGLRNANTKVETLRRQLVDLQDVVSRQNAVIFEVQQDVQILDKRLEHLEENAVIRN